MNDGPMRDAAAPRRKGSVGRSVRAVAWSFIGLRKGSEYRSDLEKVHPLHVIGVGLAAVFALVALLMALVHWIV